MSTYRDVLQDLFLFTEMKWNFLQANPTPGSTGTTSDRNNNAAMQHFYCATIYLWKIASTMRLNSAKEGKMGECCKRKSAFEKSGEARSCIPAGIEVQCAA
jgi:hypothetical protein